MRIHMMLIQFPVLVALFSSGCAMISAESSALKDTPLEVGAERQLFIDKRFISSSHNNSATIYPYADDVYLMFLTPFRHFAPSRQPEFYKHVQTREDFGLIEIQLASSRDGINWTRPFYEPYSRCM